MKNEKNNFSSSDLGKIPPQALDIEKATLGALLSLPATLDKGITELRPEIFYRDSHQRIFKAITDLHRESKGVDLLTVTERLKQTNELEMVGGVWALTELTQNCFGAFDEWVAILKQKYARRECIRIGSELMTVGFDDTIDELESYNVIDSNHKTLSDILFGSSKAQTFYDIARESMLELYNRMRNEINGIRTGIKDLDQALGGWANGDLVIIAGRPGMGKTAIALHHAKVAAKKGKHVYIFSLEMTNTRLADRVIVGETGIDNYKYKLGEVTDIEYQAVKRWVETESNLPIHLDEKSFVSIDYIISNARMRKRSNQLDLLIIDYLQLINMAQEKNGTRDQAIGQVTRKLKSLAKELNIPILLLSQLNRKVEERTTKRPMLADLRESGNIEQDADIVLFVYRPAYYKIEEHDGLSTAGLMVLEAAKNRNGISGVDIKCYHNESITNIYDEPEQFNTQEPF